MAPSDELGASGERELAQLLNTERQNSTMNTDTKAQAQHSPDEAEICRQAGLQNAKVHKWQGWDWKQYQVTITRQNHHISKTEAHAEKLAEALKCAEMVLAERGVELKEITRALANWKAAQ